ncbi:MAG TPA: twin-arginine translocase TatA/TatE family subunit [Solirubrobacteraceae bacterium]
MRATLYLIRVAAGVVEGIMGIVNPLHLIFVAVVALVVLGPKRLPELARSLGNGMREFRDSISEATGGEEHVTASLVPEEAQLVASTESPVQPAKASAPVADPGAPAHADAVQAGEQPSPPAS